MSDKQLKLFAQQLRLREYEVRQQFTLWNVVTALEADVPSESAMVKLFTVSEQASLATFFYY